MGNKKLRILFYGCLLFSIGVCVIGIRQIYDVENKRKQGVVTFYSQIKETPSFDPNTSIQEEAETPYYAIGVLRFSNKEEVAIINGINETTLLYGAGRVYNSALPNEDGNCILFGHRDSTFRFLKDLKIKDTFIVKTREKEIVYEVQSLQVITEGDPSIYQKSKGKRMTLITCYPFTMYGPALQRYQVIAYEKEEMK